MSDSNTGAIAGKVLLSLGTAIYTFIPPVVDILTPTHIFHPDWPPHARFHTMWAIISASAMGLLALWLVWRASANPHDNIRIAGIIGTGILGAFMATTALMPLFGGALTDTDGVAPLAIGLNPNLLTFAAALIMVLAGWRLASSGNR